MDKERTGPYGGGRVDGANWRSVDGLRWNADKETAAGVACREIERIRDEEAKRLGVYVSLSEAAGVFARRHPNLTRTVMEDVGSWPSSERPLTSLQRIYVPNPLPTRASAPPRPHCEKCGKRLTEMDRHVYTAGGGFGWPAVCEGCAEKEVKP